MQSINHFPKHTVKKEESDGKTVAQRTRDSGLIERLRVVNEKVL